MAGKSYKSIVVVTMRQSDGLQALGGLGGRDVRFARCDASHGGWQIGAAFGGVRKLTTG